MSKSTLAMIAIIANSLEVVAIIIGMALAQNPAQITGIGVTGLLLVMITASASGMVITSLSDEKGSDNAEKKKNQLEETNPVTLTDDGELVSETLTKSSSKSNGG